jgi:N-methylhydantoinase B
MAKFMSVEMSEHRYPLRFDYLAIRDFSGGDGAHRGGCGTAYGITALSDCVVSILGDRVDYTPFGVHGGASASGNMVRLVQDGIESIPPFRSKADRIPMHAGDTVKLASPGGGGFGPPRSRDIADVEADLNNGLISAETAVEVYGAVVADTQQRGHRLHYRLTSNGPKVPRTRL